MSNQGWGQQPQQNPYLPQQPQFGYSQQPGFPSQPPTQRPGMPAAPPAANGVAGGPRPFTSSIPAYQGQPPGAPPGYRPSGVASQPPPPAAMRPPGAVPQPSQFTPRPSGFPPQQGTFQPGAQPVNAPGYPQARPSTMPPPPVGQSMQPPSVATMQAPRPLGGPSVGQQPPLGSMPPGPLARPPAAVAGMPRPPAYPQAPTTPGPGAMSPPPSSQFSQTPGMMQPPGMAAPSFGAPAMRPAGPSMGGYDGGFQSSMGVGSSMQAVMDQFETLSLAPAAPSAGGQAPSGGPNPALFPRPAGPGADEAIGPPKPYSVANCKPQFIRTTTQAVPNSAALKARWHLPYGAIVHPLAESGGPVPVANAGNATIIRCKRCRTYMNPFMTWSDGGRRFACNVCALSNEVPVEYFSALDGSGRRIDAEQRPELSSGSVEYVAPAEYMVRAPMPPTYVFLIDVSFAAAASGMLGVACRAIKESLDFIPGGERTKVAVMTYDKTLHFYNLRAGLSAAQMLVVAETEDPFVPLPDDLLVNLYDCRVLLEALLDSIPTSFGRNGIVDSATGPALQAAFLLMNHVGGKLMLFQAGAPSVGIGRIKARDNPALYGTDKEASLRTPDDAFYKKFSAEASRFQICLDVFAAGSTYMDLPSLGALTRYTGGQIYHYPGFAADRDGLKMGAEICRNLKREVAWEAVMRIRCSKGLRVSAFHGHFFIRSTDLLALPCCDADKTYAIEITHEETVLSGQVAYIQAALLYTSSGGERRIRVHTMALPIVGDLLDLYKACDAGATVALLAKASVEKSYVSKLDDVRAAAQQKLVAALKEYRLLHTRGGFGSGPSPNNLLLPERLKSLPIAVLGMLKCSAIRGSGRDVNTDERAAVGHSIITGSAYDIVKLCYPSCYPVHSPSGNWGMVDDAGRCQLPSTVPAGLEYFDPAGAYLIDNGRVAILWLGTATPPSFYAEVFGPDSASKDPSQLKLEPAREGLKLSGRICCVLRDLRKGRELQQECYVVRQGTPMEAHVMPFFVEDRLQAIGAIGYLDWMIQLQKSVMTISK